MNKKMTRPTLSPPSASRAIKPDSAAITASSPATATPRLSSSGPRARAVADAAARRKREPKAGVAFSVSTDHDQTEPPIEIKREGRFEGRRNTKSDVSNTSNTRNASKVGNAANQATHSRDAFKKPYGKPGPASTSSADTKPAFSKPRSARSPNSKDFRPALPRAVAASLAAMTPVKEAGVPGAADITRPAHDDGTVRLSKLMSAQGIASRREADAWIAKGWVKVDGMVISALGSRILPTQKITIDRVAELEQQSRVTVLLNKPVGYVSGQAEDGHLPASVLFVDENRWEEDADETVFHPMQAKGLAPAGRLDIDSVGLIVFTQDGRVAKQLIGDGSEVEKEYLVRVEGSLSASDLALLNHGLSLDGQALRPAKVDWQNEDQLRFVLREGKKRQIRRMCELVGLTVVGLKRVRIGKIVLGHLPVGQWRYLATDETFG